jgi:hypothetical protein
MKTKRSPLTDEEKTRATTLHASGKSIYAVARNLGRSPHTLKRFLGKPEVITAVSIQREEYANMFDDVGRRTLAGVTQTDIEKSSLQQKMVSAGICVDKSALLRGEVPPTINVNALLDVAELLRNQRDAAPLPRQSQPELPPRES